jgi:uncharacterized protein YgbK (DUF1537 family)
LLSDIRAGLLERLMQLHDNQCVVVDAETQADMNCFAEELLTASAAGRRFLFRSAASLLTALANLPPQPVASDAMARYVRNGQPGAVIVGSHVKKTTEQLEELLKLPGTAAIELNVAELPAHNQELLEQTLAQVQQSHAAGQTPVIFTSRQELTFADTQARLDFGVAVSSLLMDILRGLPADLGFLISKGGITSNDTLSDGLALRSARLLGQILPGVSVVTTAADHPQFPNLPVVLFPGNVGDRFALAAAYQKLTA